MNTADSKELERENAELRERLEEAQSVLAAIRRGEIDAVVVSAAEGERVFTLEGADHAYRMLVESMNEGAATLTLDGVVLYANRRLAALLGVSATGLTGTRLAAWVAPEDVGRIEDLVRGSIDGGSSGDLTLVVGDNGSLPVHASFSSLVMHDERFCCAVITDLSLAKHHAELQLAAEEIREANDQLQQADQKKNEFLATLAHELRNPLAPIRAAAEVLKMIDYDDIRLVRARDIIERQVVYMVRLVNDLLELSRMTLGKIVLERRTENLASILDGVSDTMRTVLPGGPTLEIELPEEPLYVDVDAMRVSQAVSNVLDNAMKYTPVDGRVRLRAERDGNQAVVRIEDTGMGIEPEIMPRIFDMFVQGDRDERRVQDGLGIGLALTRRLIEMHGGTIEVASPGHGLGTTATIRLPVDDSFDVESAHPPASAGATVASKVVLIVDDNFDAAETLRALLELSGHTVKTAHGGREALETLDECRPDLVLLDIGLPDLDGYEVARRFRAHFGAACPPLIGLSGWGQDEHRKRATEAGIDAYYTKPINPAALARLLEAQAEENSRRTNG